MPRLPKSRVSVRSHNSFGDRVVTVGDWLCHIIGWIWSTVIVGGLLVSVLISYATAGTTGLTKLDPRTWFVVHPLLAYPLQTAVGFIVALIVTISAYLAHLSQRRAKTIEHPVSKLTSQNRQRMIAKVRSFWING